MHLYNSIVVSKETLNVFPLISVDEAGVGISAAMDRLIETEDWNRGSRRLEDPCAIVSLENIWLESYLNTIASDTPPAWRERKLIGHRSEAMSVITYKYESYADYFLDSCEQQPRPERHLKLITHHLTNPVILTLHLLPVLLKRLSRMMQDAISSYSTRSAASYHQ